jgi:uncharacterized lipoprotein YmbA
MKNYAKLPLTVAFLLLTGCASYDAQDRYILGDANKANAALQSERSVDLPNLKKVETTSGVRAAAAVKALNEGQTKQLASTSTGGAE